ncbi:uncharacterized protein CANTADRAFT_46947 [Suhomyces tanzawaensis NRRL Y-17324]|uniref:Uncharacterized protein n=1 Tax=Suhomyces tanzawaensis NRRL Y-17324 TaxID=984487 RepID=A0A1E4SPD3_9ASCO|nr:uncharacterized protein CANTADRAFT_46947 [Suhomyces tanzawaensis NRRL Y-17324]ODV81242.1 hypothetical protein CANTADRAFT_46947 [Suhomyces tanzawaensis NRRL Y-17324]
MSPSSTSTSPASKEFHSPLASPHPLCDHPESNIFERSVQEPVMLPQPLHPLQGLGSSSGSHRRPRSYTHNSSISLHSGPLLKNEDYIPPALDATAQLLSDGHTNLDDVEMIYSNRRNSSVIGLNMALGRPFTPSRKNSSYSINQLNHPPPINTNLASTNNNNSTQVQSPVSPPKLTSSASALSFYSYADMISNDEFARRPSFKGSYSQGVIPTLKNGKTPVPPSFTKRPSFTNHRNPSTSSQLSKQINEAPAPNQAVRSRFGSLKSLGRKDSVSQKNSGSPGPSNLNKFLISPESSDSDELDYVSLKNSRRSSIQAPASKDRRKSVSSTTSSTFGQPPQFAMNTFNDNESLISSSIGDCIRQSTTEINGH